MTQKVHHIIISLASNENQEANLVAGLFEGGGYLEKGVWRGCENCRMRTNEEPDFCPVCQQALTKLINFYTVR